MATYLIAGGTAVVAVALVPTVARILSKILPANDKPGTPPVREAGKTSGFKKVTHAPPLPHPSPFPAPRRVHVSLGRLRTLTSLLANIVFITTSRSAPAAARPSS